MRVFSSGLIGDQMRSKLTGRVGKVVGYDPGIERVDLYRGVRSNEPFVLLKVEGEFLLERLHADQIEEAPVQAELDTVEIDLREDGRA